MNPCTSSLFIYLPSRCSLPVFPQWLHS